MHWNRLPLAVASVQEPLAFKRQLDTYIFPYILLLSLFSPQYGLFWAICPFPIIKNTHTLIHKCQGLCSVRYDILSTISP